ncbi:metalloendopeptidase [uncultured Mediterranean phage uvDeep-CGR0-KM22-C158]|nr:metalloendopeptidase [uncultured Mediterranean phage uvDeep-CGR0-KM22-C158]
MPKLYYPTPDELQGATPLHEGGWGYDDNRGTWFDVYQPILLRLVNTIYGRDLFCIDSWEKQPYPIVRINKNSVTYFIGRWGGERHFRIDARIGAKYGNIVRERWVHIKKALDQMVLQMLMEMPPYIIHNGRGIPMPSGAAAITAYPDPHTETATVDGYVNHTETNLTWAALRAAAGNGARDVGAIEPICLTKSWTSTDRWTVIYRSCFLFDLTSVNNAATVDDATFSLYGESLRDDGVNTPMDMNIYTCAPASNTALVGGDYDSFGTTDLSTTVADSDFNIESYENFTLNSTGEAECKFDDITKIGVRDDSNDVDNSAPSPWESDKATSIVTYQAETSATSKDPKLVVNYTSPFRPRAIIF